MNSEHLDNGYKCALCFALEKTVDAFNCHLTDIHDANISKSTDINYLESRVRTENTKNFKCSWCEFAASSEEILNAHLIVHTDGIIARSSKSDSKLVYKDVTDGLVVPSVKLKIVY